MTTEELNKRLRFCAEHGLPYSDKLWAVLVKVWDTGQELGYSGHGDIELQDALGVQL